MEISDQDLRAMVREAVARHGHPAPADAVTPAAGFAVHASHGKFLLMTGGDPDGRCLIEPSVPCTHCGYCQSMGH